MQHGVQEIRQTIELDVGEPRIAVERRDDYVTVTHQHFERSDVVAGDRAADEPVREQQHGPAQVRIGEDRRLRSLLHVRHRVPRGQWVIGIRIVGGRRVADEQRIFHRLRRPVDVELAIVGNDDIDDQRVGRVREQLRHVALAASVPNAFPVVLRALARQHAAEVLCDIAATDSVGSWRQRIDDGERVGSRRRREQAAGKRDEHDQIARYHC